MIVAGASPCASHGNIDDDDDNSKWRTGGKSYPGYAFVIVAGASHCSSHGDIDEDSDNSDTAITGIASDTVNGCAVLILLLADVAGIMSPMVPPMLSPMLTSMLTSMSGIGNCKPYTGGVGNWKPCTTGGASNGAR